MKKVARYLNVLFQFRGFQIQRSMNLRIRTDLNPEWTQILRYFNLLEGDDVHDDDEVEDSAIPESHQLILAAAWHNIKVGR